MKAVACGIGIPYSQAEILRKKLISLGVIDHSLAFIREEKNLIIPIVLTKKEAEKLLSSSYEEVNLEIGEFTFLRIQKSPNSLQEALENIIPENLQIFVPKSYDVIGDIAVIDIPPEIITYKKIIGMELLSIVSSVKTVYRKASPVLGQKRIRELDFLTGEKKCSTLHTEHGIKLYVDICDAYFSPRLGTEHHRVALSCNNQEIIADLFTGVGAFPLHIAKKHDATIYAIDINQRAIECLEESIKINKLKGKIIPINKDCREIINEIPKTNRIIMNLPSHSHNFLDVMCNIIQPGGILYFYHFVNAENAERETQQILEDGLKRNAWKISKIVNFHKIRESAPREIHVCLEVKVSPL